MLPAILFRMGLFRSSMFSTTCLQEGILLLSPSLGTPKNPRRCGRGAGCMQQSDPVVCWLQHCGHINFCVSLPALFLRSWCSAVQTAYRNHNLLRKPSLKQFLLARTAPFCSSIHQAQKQNAVCSIKDLNFFFCQSLKSNNSVLKYL